ncbi:zinc ribbon domain-containing protein YjdM [Billgrantia desiderata]|uniref:Alkylphosphonate utilization protein n=1 Tax=Billgrantia desiderata TaxID=52021 RepID=A0ABS9B5T0_9GAMM|nr:zinc ribbon domain-containing protein YjdM [Halomonas desiderata]MCE8011446.1 alkylphosphonate utilization protein [Halomonas desiderata]MCE8043054.1 alkylphosphonate utilization protein [Halomonas desiderata]MCE8047430.1 alkylphosphonate utilization protein [Halomonas desiderata]OUE38743.1 alkylphosphonate utilization protein [Halomonas desiderata SP1]
MSALPNCPACHSEYTYEVAGMYACPECGHEWSSLTDAGEAGDGKVVRDANGNVLQDGDSVTVIKDLKVKGTSSVVKVGTKVKGIRLVEGDHDIDCKIDGFGPMKLKSEFVKKA